MRHKIEREVEKEKGKGRKNKETMREVGKEEKEIRKLDKRW